MNNSEIYALVVLSRMKSTVKISLFIDGNRERKKENKGMSILIFILVLFTRWKRSNKKMNHRIFI